MIIDGGKTQMETRIKFLLAVAVVVAFYTLGGTDAPGMENTPVSPGRIFASAGFVLLTVITLNRWDERVMDYIMIFIEPNEEPSEETRKTSPWHL